MDELTKVIQEALAKVEQAVKKYNESGKNKIIDVNMKCCTLSAFDTKKAEILLHDKYPGMKQTETRYFEDLKTDFYEAEQNGVILKTNFSTLVKNNEQVDL